MSRPEPDALAPGHENGPRRHGPFQATFLRLKQNTAGDEGQAFFDYVYAPEKALEAFAQKELDRESDSVQAVERLLFDHN